MKATRKFPDWPWLWPLIGTEFTRTSLMQQYVLPLDYHFNYHFKIHGVQIERPLKNSSILCKIPKNSREKIFIRQLKPLLIQYNAWKAHDKRPQEQMLYESLSEKFSRMFTDLWAPAIYSSILVVPFSLKLALKSQGP